MLRVRLLRVGIGVRVRVTMTVAYPKPDASPKPVTECAMPPTEVVDGGAMPAPSTAASPPQPS